jgi:hypothetical protein
MDNPNITIGGQNFPVPPLSIGQLKIVVPALLRLKTLKIDALTEENIEDLTTITYLAILRGTPNFPKNEFTNMAGTVDDMLIAYPIIAEQCGMRRKKAEDQAAGEAIAG